MVIKCSVFYTNKAYAIMLDGKFINVTCHEAADRDKLGAKLSNSPECCGWFGPQLQAQIWTSLQASKKHKETTQQFWFDATTGKQVSN